MNTLGLFDYSADLQDVRPLSARWRRFTTRHISGVTVHARGCVLDRIAHLTVTLMAAFLPAIAGACPDGQYDVCVGFCACVPNSGQILPGDPRKDAAKALDALAKGDRTMFAQAIGRLAIRGQWGGPLVNDMLKGSLSPEAKAFLDEVIGEGVILVITKAPSGESPSVMLGDLKYAAGYRIPLVQSKATPHPGGAPARGRRVFHATGAACISTAGNDVAAGWVDEPELIDKKTLKRTKFINASVQAGDIVEITANKICKVPSGAPFKATDTFRMVFSHADQVSSDVATQMKHFLIGRRSTEKAVRAVAKSGDAFPSAKVPVANTELASGHFAQWGVRQHSDANPGVSDFSVPRGARSFGVYVGYAKQATCSGDAGVDHGRKVEVLVDGKQLDHVDKLTYGAGPAFLYGDLPPGATKLALRNSEVTGGHWCAEIIWKEPTFFMPG